MQPQTPSLKDILTDYRHNKLNEELTGDWVAVFFYRPLALLLSWPLIRLRTTPNQVTVTGLLTLPFMGAVAGLVRPDAAISAVCGLAIAYCILDCTDGTIARLTNRQSDFGHYLDFVGGTLYRAVLYGSLGYISTRGGVAWADGGLLFGVLIIAAWIAVFSRLCRVYAESRLFRKPQAAAWAARTWFDRLYDSIFSVLSGVEGLLPIAVPICWWNGWMRPLILVILFYWLLEGVYTQATILWRVKA